MSKRACVVAVIVALLAQVFVMQDAVARRGGGGARMGGGGRSMSRPSAPMQRPATPAQRPSTPSGGFNFNNDIGRPPMASQLPSGPGIGNRPGNGGGIGNGGVGNRPPGSTRPPVPPVVAPMPPWGWNGGVIWYPAYGYWGGGFWGPWGYGYYGPYYGEYTHTVTHEVVKSYEIAPDSPGAKMLANYGLTQTQCSNEGNLVVVFGPENSIICAQPNATVAAGQYELNTDDLTIAPLAGS